MPNQLSECNHPQMIDVRGVAIILNISTRSVWRLVNRSELPKPIRVGRNARWRVSDIEQWIEQKVTDAHRVDSRRRRPR